MLLGFPNVLGSGLRIGFRAASRVPEAAGSRVHLFSGVLLYCELKLLLSDKCQSSWFYSLPHPRQIKAAAAEAFPGNYGYIISEKQAL
jgi:hypothetical protein